MTFERVCLWVLATHQNQINLLAYDWVMRRLTQAPGDAPPLFLKILATPEMATRGEYLKDTLADDCCEAEVIYLPDHLEAGALELGGPEAWAETFRVYYEGHAGLAPVHVWAYGGATKPLSIGLWSLAAELGRTDLHRTHVPLYPDQRGTRRWLVGEREEPLEVTYRMDHLAGLLGGRIHGETELLTPRGGAGLPDVHAEDVDECKSMLGTRDELEAWLITLGAERGWHVNEARPSIGPVFERLVLRRALDALHKHGAVAYAYANVTFTDADDTDIGEADLAFTSPSGRAFVLESKSYFFEPRVAHVLRGQPDAARPTVRRQEEAKHRKHKSHLRGLFSSQSSAMASVFGSYGYFAMVLPRVADRREFRPRWTTLWFDAADRFEAELLAWVDRNHGL